MGQCAVLIVDPLKSRRDRIGQSFRRRFDVVTAHDPAGGLERVATEDPAIVLLSLPQAQGHGLDLALKVRELEGGADRVIVVYGRTASDDRLTPDVRARFRKRFKLDGFLAGLPQPGDLPPELAAGPEPQVRREIGQAPRAPAARDAVQTTAARKAVDTTASRPALKAQSARLTAPPPPTLGELLTSEASVENLVALLKTEVAGDMIEDLEDNTEEISWSDLLRAKATAKNISKALRKEIKISKT